MTTAADKPFDSAQGKAKGGLEDTVATSSAICYIDGDRGVPRVHLVARGVARERSRHVVDVVRGEPLQGGVELRQVHERHSRHNRGSSWGIFGVESGTTP